MLINTNVVILKSPNAKLFILQKLLFPVLNILLGTYKEYETT